MRKILIIGAGRSASSLIKYLLDKSESENLELTLADLSVELAQKKINHHPRARAIALDIKNREDRERAIENANLVISMLPAFRSEERRVGKECRAWEWRVQ